MGDGGGDLVENSKENATVVDDSNQHHQNKTCQVLSRKYVSQRQQHPAPVHAIMCGG
jgi:hypothetical protein